MQSTVTNWENTPLTIRAVPSMTHSADNQPLTLTPNNVGSSPRVTWLMFGLALLLVMVFGYIRLSHSSTSTATKSVDPAAPAQPVVPRPTAAEIAGDHLAWAATETTARIKTELQPIPDFFAAAKTRTPEFSKQALSWSSKWRLIVDYVPGTKGTRHDTFLRTKFETILFSSAQMEQLITTSIKNYQFQVESVENELLVRIRKRAENFPAVASLAKLNDKELQQHYEAAIARVISSSQQDFARSAAGEVVSLIAGEVLTQVAVRLGVSAGILGTGAATSPYTLGIGIVVGVIVDQIVTYIWNWAADPKGELTKELNHKFDEISSSLLVGTAEQPGLEPRLQKYAQERTALRNAAILKMLETHLEQSR